MADFFDDRVDEDGEFDDPLREATSEHTIFLIDCSQQMLEVANVQDLEGYDPSDTYLQIALKVVRELMKQHIISSPKDEMGVVFYGAAEAKNNDEFPNVNIALDLEETTADRIREIEALQDNFSDAIGSIDELSPDDVRDGLWASSNILQASPGRASKRVMVFTNRDEPCEDGTSESAKNQILSRVQALHESKIETELFNLTPDGQEFSMGFWGDIIKNPEEELGTQSFNAEPLRLKDLTINIRRKSYKKRALASLFWYIGPDFHFGVRLYALVQKATTSKSVPIDLRTNEVLKATTVILDDDTGAMVEKITKYSFPKDEKQAPRFPKIIITDAERKSLKELISPGIRLICFKPVEGLKEWYQLRPATFVYPDERVRKGSATAFIALHDRMLKRDVYALCCVVRNKSAEPRLVAAVPQQEEIDANGTQIAPPGFNFIWLPYKDDIRHPDTDPSFLGPSMHKDVSDEQLSAASEMLSKLDIPEFVVGSIPNPHLQRHYRVVEALALGEEPPELEAEKDDLTKPQPFDDETVEKIVAFRDAVYGKGNTGALKKVLKRKADDKETQNIDVKEMVREGKLAKLTVKILMDLCRQQRLSAQGRKQELIERLTKHVNP